MAFRSHISIFGQTLRPRRFDILFIYLNYFYCRMKKKEKKICSIHTRPFSFFGFTNLMAKMLGCCCVLFCSPLFYRCEGYAIKINSTFRIKLPYWNSYCARRCEIQAEWIFATNWDMFANLTLVWGSWLAGLSAHWVTAFSSSDLSFPNYKRQKEKNMGWRIEVNAWITALYPRRQSNEHLQMH